MEHERAGWTGVKQNIAATARVMLNKKIWPRKVEISLLTTSLSKRMQIYAGQYVKTQIYLKLMLFNKRLGAILNYRLHSAMKENQPLTLLDLPELTVSFAEWSGFLKVSIRSIYWVWTQYSYSCFCCQSMHSKSLHYNDSGTMKCYESGMKSVNRSAAHSYKMTGIILLVDGLVLRRSIFTRMQMARSCWASSQVIYSL